jgi:RHS repeat-associated protein
VLREQKADEALYNYRYAYQGQFAEKDEETGWNHFELREYDAVIGRFTRIDPARQFASPYVGMGNDPVSGVDPTGGCVDSNGKVVPCNGAQDGMDGFHTTILNDVAVTRYRLFSVGSPFDRATAIWERNGWNYSTYGNINFGFYSRPKDLDLFQGRGYSLSAIVPLPSPFFSIDRVTTSGDGMNDLYLTMGLGFGLDISGGSHITSYTVSGGKALTADDIGGLSVHYGGGLGPATFQQSFNVEFGERWYDIDVGRVKAYSYGVSAGPTLPVIGSGRVGVGYTWNLSRIGRWLNGN